MAAKAQGNTQGHRSSHPYWRAYQLKTIGRFVSIPDNDSIIGNDKQRNRIAARQTPRPANCPSGGLVTSAMRPLPPGEPRPTPMNPLHPNQRPEPPCWNLHLPKSAWSRPSGIPDLDQISGPHTSRPRTSRARSAYTTQPRFRAFVNIWRSSSESTLDTRTGLPQVSSGTGEHVGIISSTDERSSGGESDDPSPVSAADGANDAEPARRFRLSSVRVLATPQGTPLGSPPAPYPPSAGPALPQLPSPPLYSAASR